MWRIRRLANAFLRFCSYFDFLKYADGKPFSTSKTTIERQRTSPLSLSRPAGRSGGGARGSRELGPVVCPRDRSGWSRSVPPVSGVLLVSGPTAFFRLFDPRTSFPTRPVWCGTYVFVQGTAKGEARGEARGKGNRVMVICVTAHPIRTSKFDHYSLYASPLTWMGVNACPGNGPRITPN